FGRSSKSILPFSRRMLLMEKCIGVDGDGWGAGDVGWATTSVNKSEKLYESSSLRTIDTRKVFSTNSRTTGPRSQIDAASRLNASSSNETKGSVPFRSFRVKSFT